jgi:hypothetical protein
MTGAHPAVGGGGKGHPSWRTKNNENDGWRGRKGVGQ